MKDYLSQKNLNNFKPNPKCVNLTHYNDLNLKIGYAQKYEIAAGASFFQIVEVEEADSIIFCGFQTTTLDIMFGFYKISQLSELSSEDEVSHLGLEEIFDLTKIESSAKPIKVSFIAKDPGLYKIIWSNEHSWFKGKTLKYRISILKPALSQNSSQSIDLVGADLPSISNIPSSKRKALQKLIEIPRSVMSAHSNMDSQKRKILLSSQYQEQVYFIYVDLEREVFKISNADMQDESTHDLESLDDISFILDELLHTLVSSQKLESPTTNHYVKVFLLMSKSQRSQELINKFDHKTVNFLQQSLYDIYLLFDTDANVICQSLNLKETHGKSKKKLLAESSLIFIKADELNFVSSICLRQKLVQDENLYSFEVGNLGALELMTEIHIPNRDSSISNDEVSGGGQSPFEPARNIPAHQTGKQFCKQLCIQDNVKGTKQLREVWQDPRALAIALTNYQKLCGVKVMVNMCFEDIEQQNHEHNMEKNKRYIEELRKEIAANQDYSKDQQVLVDIKDENTYIYGLRNIYKFLEVHQQQYWE